MNEILMALAVLLNGGETQGTDSPAAMLEQQVIEQTAALSQEQQLAEYLGEQQSRASSSPRYFEGARVSRLQADPAIRAHFSTIRDSWFEGALTAWRPEMPLFDSMKELVQLKVMIARNLFFRNGSATPASIRAEYGRIQDLRKAYRDLHVFAGREVLYAASGDRQKIGGQKEFLFGHAPTQARLRRQADRFTFYRPRLSDDMKLLEDRLSSAPRLTLVFEGHGRDKALKLGGALSAEDLGKRLSERRQNSTPILVLDACQSHTFSRHLMEALGKQGMSSAMPVVITPEEYGQDFIKSVYADRFLSRDLRLGRGRVQLGNLMDEAWITTSVYVPDPARVPAQIL